ncbi:MAG: hypothetical protein U1E67_14440 [Hyphomicrobiales bacterium]
MSSAIPIIDHDHVRSWVEARNGRPARVAKTGKGENPGTLCIRFEPQNGIEELPWDKWLRWFERNRLALIVSKNGFHKLVPLSAEALIGQIAKPRAFQLGRLIATPPFLPQREQRKRARMRSVEACMPQRMAKGASATGAAWPQPMRSQ